MSGPIPSRGSSAPGRVVVWGAGGHAAVVAEAVAASGGDVAAFLDDTAGAPDAVLGRPVVRTLDAALDAAPVLALGVGDNAVRLALATRAEAAGFALATVVHPAAWVSPSATLGAGTVVMAGAVVQARASLGRAVILNTGATVDHDSVLGAGVHVSPGAHLAGAVTLGACAWIGTGASVRDHVSVGARTVVGVGAAVVRDLPPDVVAFGVPARPASPHPPTS